MSGGSITPWAALEGTSIVDLAQPMMRGMPVSPSHPRFEMALIRRHGDVVRSDGASAANELIVMGGHVGTHIDALAHVSQDGLLHGGIDAASVTGNMGFATHGIDSIAPILCRGVLLDVAAVRGRPFEAGEEVTVADLDAAAERSGIEVGAGDAVLIHTGWGRHWSDPDTFLGQTDGAPGPGVDAAGWLVERRVRLAGAETIAFERISAGSGHATLPVHRILLFEAGIFIVETMRLGELAGTGATEFLFVLAPLPLVGATGSPSRPLAILPGLQP